MTSHSGANDCVTERFQEFKCSESEKKILQRYLFACLAEGKNCMLKRNRVMIMENEKQNSYIILEIARTSDENRRIFICPKCSHKDYCDLLTSEVQAECFKSCLHAELCKLIWGDQIELDVDVVNNEEDDLIEVVAEKPRYIAVVHVSNKSSKGPGIIVLTSKMLKPKCVVCPGQDKCIHLTIHLQQYKRGLEEDTPEENCQKRLRMERIEPEKPQKKADIDPDVFDPFQHDGPEANVFKVTVDFIQTKDGIADNRRNAIENEAFNKEVLVARYDPDETCPCGNYYDEEQSIIFVESTNVKIHHTKEVRTLDKIVLYRPTKSRSNFACFCKKFYTGEDDRLLRVSPANNRMTGKQKTLHFVSLEFYFTFLGKLPNLKSGKVWECYRNSRPPPPS